MLLFLVVGVVGFALLLLALVFDGFLDAVLPSFDLPGGDIVSGPALGAFAAAFGAAGALVMGSTDAGVGIACVVGVAAGLVLGGLVGLAARALTRTGTDATPRASDLVGLPGTVVTSIPAGGFGEVTVRLSGSPQKLNARAAAALDAGAAVVVDEVLSSSSVRVSPRP